jgi:hypothetical protein
MTLGTIVARCSSFSGYNLGYEIVGGSDPIIRIEDPAHVGESTCVFGLLTEHLLSEIYGRKRHWGIDLEEQIVIAQALREART